MVSNYINHALPARSRIFMPRFTLLFERSPENLPSGRR
jgi:hypothetical protein